MKRETPALAQVALAATIWGSIPVFVRAVDASSFVIVFWRVAFAGLTLLTYLAARGRLREVLTLPRRRVFALMGMGALLTLNWVLFFTAISLTDVAVAVLLAYCGPVFVAALTPLVTREPFDRRVVVPLALALGGVAVIVNPASAAFDGSQAIVGAGLAFASAVTYAVLVLNAKRLLQGIPATVYMVVEYGTACMLLLPVVLLSEGPSAPREWLSLAALGVVNTALTGFLFLSALRRARADHAAIITYAEPVSAVVIAALVLGEPLTAGTVLGGVLVVVAGIIVSRLRTGASVEGPPVLLDATDEVGGSKRTG